MKTSTNETSPPASTGSSESRPSDSDSPDWRAIGKAAQDAARAARGIAADASAAGVPVGPVKPAPLPVNPLCPKCNGTGNAGWKTPMAGYRRADLSICDCPEGSRYARAADAYYTRATAARAHAAFSRSGIPALYADLTIDSWAALAQNDAGKRAALIAVQRILTGSASKPGLCLYGPFGTGKTGLLTALLSHWMAEGRPALWLEWYDFIDAVQSRYGLKEVTDATQTAQYVIEQAQTVDLLLLDDLGDPRRHDAETSDRQRLLYQIVNARMNKGLPLLVSTNLTPDQFIEQFGARTWERIAYVCEVVQVAGRNLRETGSR
jgi:DNA replication protein DnaC